MTARNPSALRRDPEYMAARRRAHREQWKQYWADKDPYDIPGTRVCSRCGEEKPRVAFAYNRTGKSGLQTICKVCGVRRWRKKRYGSSDLDHNECVICGSGDRLSQDHCHQTGTRRGTLCGNCNSLLGFAKDDVETLRAAILYLETHSTGGLYRIVGQDE